MTNDELMRVLAEVNKNHEIEANESNGLMVSNNGSMVFNEWTSTKSTIYNEISVVEIVEKCDSIEVVYKEKPIVTNLEFKHYGIFKIIFSCKDGKWNKSERIYGRVIPESKESYEFP